MLWIRISLRPFYLTLTSLPVPASKHTPHRMMQPQPLHFRDGVKQITCSVWDKIKSKKLRELCFS